MHDIALSAANHDLLIVDGDFVIIDGAERVAQQIKITLLFLLGEWFLDISKGVPYLEKILIKRPNLNHIRAIIREKIADVPDVSNVKELQLSLQREKRSLTVTYTAETKYGLIQRKEVLGYGS